MQWQERSAREQIDKVAIAAFTMWLIWAESWSRVSVTATIVVFMLAALFTVVTAVFVGRIIVYRVIARMQLPRMPRKPRKSSAYIRCKFCGQPCRASTVHLHSGGLVGDECCWDERLRSSE